ncbi:PiggyBac transposable element-derived protein 4 [Cucumispora dikerogammari]|nr:PiggyBac transposable element-derived protein 4 [Cucumispora dikerogammari]
MGVDSLPNLKLYWIKKDDQIVDFRRSYVFEKMSYVRLSYIRKHFRLTAYVSNELSIPNHIDKKTLSIMSSINNLLLKACHIEKCVAIDESTIPHKGRFGALVYNKSKPNKGEIKLYALCSSETGYCYKVKLYTGKTTAVDKLIKELTKPMRNEPYKLYLDNFYTTINNVTQCAAGKIFTAGACRINKRGLPKNFIKLASKQLQKNQMILVNNGQINLILLQDKKFVIILSTVKYVALEEYVNTGKKLSVGGASYEVLEKNTKVKFIDDYNLNMRGVDLLDQKISYYGCNKKSNRWTFKLSLLF